MAVQFIARAHQMLVAAEDSAPSLIAARVVE
jgi:hypothetical protein